MCHSSQSHPLDGLLTRVLIADPNSPLWLQHHRYSNERETPFSVYLALSVSRQDQKKKAY